VPRVGFPDYDTFHAAYRALAELHDKLWEQTGVAPERTVLGGFSMGSVMSYSLGLGPDRPTVAGLLPFSGFIPTVDDWHADLTAHAGTRVLISHGRADPIMDVNFARRAEQALASAGLDVTYQESDIGHSIDPSHLARARTWLAQTLP
jgi:phospholipase/carboxylesterase